MVGLYNVCVAILYVCVCVKVYIYALLMNGGIVPIAYSSGSDHMTAGRSITGVQERVCVCVNSGDILLPVLNFKSTKLLPLYSVYPSCVRKADAVFNSSVCLWSDRVQAVRSPAV